MKHDAPIRDRIGIALITSGGLGRLRPAPGTWGSLPPVAVAAIGGGACLISGVPANTITLLVSLILGALLAAASLACVVWGDVAEARFNGKDPSQVVADETAGQSLALLALPVAAYGSWEALAATLAVGFLSFRAFDIWKPTPARGLQRVPGGWGILLDDLVAGGYAWVVTRAFVWIVVPVIGPASL